jgi:hypothetical protein
MFLKSFLTKFQLNLERIIEPNYTEQKYERN